MVCAGTLIYFRVEGYMSAPTLLRYLTDEYVMPHE